MLKWSILLMSDVVRRATVMVPPDPTRRRAAVGKLHGHAVRRATLHSHRLVPVQRCLRQGQHDARCGLRRREW